MSQAPQPTQMKRILSMLAEDGITPSQEQMQLLESGLHLLDFGKVQQDRHAYLTAMRLLKTRGQRYTERWLQNERKRIWGEMYHE